MARQPRKNSIDPLAIQAVHITSRCVRRARLCGVDRESGKDLDYRREWIRERIEFLASVYAIDCLSYCVMENHIHLCLRSRCDVAETWDDHEVARRWLLKQLNWGGKSDQVKQPKSDDIQRLAKDKARINQLRIRLSDISWWMKDLKQPIAVRANQEDGVRGHFWEQRFSSPLLLDTSALLAASMYVDLNPIRAKAAQTPEASRYTAAKDRIDDLKQRESSCRDTHAWERTRARLKSGWMSPIEIDERRDPPGPDCCPAGRRPSRKGFLPLSLCQYLELLDATGRMVAKGKSGTIPKRLQPILVRLGIKPDCWYQLVTEFGSLFRRAAGRAESIAQEAIRRGQRWLVSPGAACFQPPQG